MEPVSKREILVSDDKEKKHTHLEHHTVSISIAVFSVVSVTIGAGMVAVPKSSYESGIPWAIGYYLFNYVIWIYSIHLFIRAAEASGKYSIPSLGYECFGRWSLYFVNILQFIGFGFLPIAYYIIFAGLLSSLLKMIPAVEKGGFWEFLGSQWFSVLVLAVLIFPLIIKKKIQELKIAGMLLFTGVVLFIILMFVLRILSGSRLPYHNHEDREFYKLEFGKEFLSSLSTALVAYGFQSAFFPIYNSLKVKSYYNGMKFTFLGITFWFIIYMMVMFVSVYSFGIHIKGDVLNNVEEVEEWESYVLRGIFLLVMSTHTPFIFFIGKESLLALFGLVYRRCKKYMKKKRRAKRRAKREARKAAKLNGLKTEEVKGPNKSVIRPMQINSFERTFSVSSDGSDTESSDSESDYGEQSDTEIVIMNSVDKNMSSAIGYSTQVVEDDKEEGEFDSDEDDANKPIGAEDILPGWMYYSVTLSLYAFVVFSSWIIEDVEFVIKFIGSMANATLNITLPGIFYFIIMRRNKANPTPTWKLILALALSVYGLVMGIGLTGVNIWTTISPLKEMEE
jgi:amino acid permease